MSILRNDETGRVYKYDDQGGVWEYQYTIGQLPSDIDEEQPIIILAGAATMKKENEGLAVLLGICVALFFAVIIGISAITTLITGA